jgi:hypothetical protein
MQWGNGVVQDQGREPGQCKPDRLAKAVSIKSRHSSVVAESSAKDSLDSRELEVGTVSQRHVVKLRTLNVVYFMEEIAPIIISVLECLLDGGALMDGTDEDIASSLLTNKADVPVNNVQRNLRLTHDCVLVNPRVGVQWLTVSVLLFHGGPQLNHKGNVVFLKDGKPLAIHSSSDNTLKEGGVEVDRIILLGHRFTEQANQFNGGLVHGTTLRDCDVVGSKPRKLSQGTDEALIGALGALFGERRLRNGVNNTAKIWATGLTYSMGDLYMLDKHDHFLGRDEPFEVCPGLNRIVGKNLGRCPVPKHTTSKREKVLHKSGLTRQLNLNRALSKTTNAAKLDILMVLLGAAHSVLHWNKLYKGIHGLGGGPIHDDVDGFFNIAQHSAVAANERHNLRSFGRKRDLEELEQNTWKGSGEYSRSSGEQRHQ